MKSAKLAAVIGTDPKDRNTGRVLDVLDLFGIPYQVFDGVPSLLKAAASGGLSDVRYAVIGPVSVLGDPSFAVQLQRPGAPHSLFAYVSNAAVQSANLLQDWTAGKDVTLVPIQGDKVQVQVSSNWPDLTGPMHGIRAEVSAGQGHRLAKTDRPDSIKTIIGNEAGPVFFQVERGGLQLFVHCSSEMPSLKDPIKGPRYDIKDDFLSAVPLVMYLKWAFRDVCWQSNEAGACLIIDDPILKTKYGFCNFREIDRQMQEHSFTTNVAVIPWNWQRTSADMATLVRNSAGRISVSVHGCDHTGAEFGCTALPTLNSKAAVAKLRMERHKAKTGISHDLVMVFPQGVFSKESLSVLQQHQYVAAVNTEVLPTNIDHDRLTVGDTWRLAIDSYGSFPLFARRYPSHGLENFAFDLLLGKPCLIVEHHKFFKGHGRKAVDFIDALNSLKCDLKWRALGDVLKRAYQWRLDENGTVRIRMFANELLLANEGSQKRRYHVEKTDSGSVGVMQVLANGAPVEWTKQNGTVTFECEIAPKAEVSLQVEYRMTPQPVDGADRLNGMSKVAVRRYLSEFRDNFLDRHEGLLQLARKTKGLLAGR